MNNFDEIINRKNSNSVKYDDLEKYFGKDNLAAMWVADMDFKAPSFIYEEFSKRIEHGVYGYTKIDDELIYSVINWQKRQNNWNISKDELLFTNGVVPTYSACIEAFSNEGDEVIVQTPVYFPLFNCVKNNNRKVVYNQLINENGYYKIDFEDLKSKITKKTKILTLCSPHNPVGRVWSKDELTKLANICLENNIIIVSDEIHSDLVYKKFTPIASINEEIANITITLNSAGKTFNIAGLNCSYTICKNKNLYEILEKVIIKREINHINLFGLIATKAVYEKGNNYLNELLIYLQNNINIVENELKNTHIKYYKPEATYLLWLDFSSYKISHHKIKDLLINDANCALNDGLTFGKNGLNHFRLNIAQQSSLLIKNLSKINKTFKL